MTTAREMVETFTVEDGRLVRKVIPRRGEPYDHRCPLAEYRELAYAVLELTAGGFTIDTLVAHAREACAGGAAGDPSYGRAYPSFTNAAVAIAYWKERGLIDTRLRRNYPASATFFEDAMCEFHALAEEPAEACDPTSTACPTCSDAHPPCRKCGAPTRCPPDEVGVPFLLCDPCDDELPR